MPFSKFYVFLFFFYDEIRHECCFQILGENLQTMLVNKDSALLNFCECRLTDNMEHLRVLRLILELPSKSENLKQLIFESFDYLQGLEHSSAHC